MKARSYIIVKGVNTNNLKNIDVKIPKGKITAVVGVSGAGKTSLAFDTIYAEGYLRYIESISPYIRQFLDKIEKPPIEFIDGLPPAIAFRHKKPAKNPRSIVATSLDIYDYLRILYAKISDFHCPTCGDKIKKYSIDEIVYELPASRQGKIQVCFEYSGDVAFLINRGYYFHLHENAKKRIDSTVKDKTIYVIIDTITITPDIKKETKSRLFEALDKSIAFGKGALIFHEGEKVLFPTELYCPRCEVRYPTPDEHLFSFNSPKGACLGCNGFGDIQTLDPELIFDSSLSLSEGAARPFNSPVARRFGQRLIEKAVQHGININTPVKRLDDDEISFLMEGDRFFSGIQGFFDRLKSKSYKIQARVFVSRYTTYIPCDKCGGSRLNDIARSFNIAGKSIADFLAFTIEEARDFMARLDPSRFIYKISPEVFTDISLRLNYLVESGLPYIGLNRPTFTLSRGEYQRINLAFILGSTLSDSLLIIDQPSSDLHPKDYEKLKMFLVNLKENGNTVLLVEHNKDIVQYCDFVLELGPLSGEKGGRVVFSGEKDDFFAPGKARKTITQERFSVPVVVEKKKRVFNKWYSFQNACMHNLKNFDFRIPARAFTVITGVSGAGKTTLLYNEIYLKKTVKDVVFIDPGVGNLRSSTIIAGFFEVYPAIRELFAQLKESRVNRFTPGHFSFNSARGRCDSCKGKGYVEVEMQFLPSVRMVCDTCAGKGFNPDVLKIRLDGRNIRETLDLSVSAFLETGGHMLPQKERDTLVNIEENGLGYIKLGLQLKMLSSGELQRIKLIKHLGKKKTGKLFLIDEPSFGLHEHDVEMVKKSIHRIIQENNTVVAAEHNMRLIASADYVIELGPGGGENGGNLIFQGETGALARASDSVTGLYLKKNKKNT